MDPVENLKELYFKQRKKTHYLRRKKFLSFVQRERKISIEFRLKRKNDRTVYEFMTMYINHLFKIEQNLTTKLEEIQLYKNEKKNRLKKHQMSFVDHLMKNPHINKEKIRSIYVNIIFPVVSDDSDDDRDSFENYFHVKLGERLSRPKKSSKPKKSKRVCKCLKKDFSYDSIDQSKPDDLDVEFMIYLHRTRRFGHCVTFDYAMMILSSVQKRAPEFESRCYSNLEIKFKCPSFKENRDKNNKFLNHGSTEKCSEEVSVSYMIRQLKSKPNITESQKSEVLKTERKLENETLPILRREQMKKDEKLSDCIRCLDHSGLNGLGYPINNHSIGSLGSLNSLVWSRTPIDRIRECKTCKLLWCDFCKVSFENESFHCYVSCAQYKIITSDSPMDENEKLISRTSKKCPGCQINIEKIDACNHIHCDRCKTHFCYICGVQIEPPYYSHFDYDLINGCPMY